MPVFEYKCKDCNSKYEIFHKSSLNPEEVICPSCRSKNSYKLLSAFSAVGISTQNISSCESGNCGAEPSYSGGCASGMCGLN
jgi:putative FmdB family regulatory protein